ncbi:MAG: hypothetical protein C5B59_15325 [Bacteroidetes bacterium]|nr:MAG: hypothetical protein C5B59_15325 [Bacteroidota bacterium]
MIVPGCGFNGKLRQRILPRIYPAILVLALLSCVTRMPAASQADRSCQAADQPSFLQCASEARQGGIDRIIINGTIDCGRNLACGGILIGINRSFEVTGGTADAGFSRAAENHASFGISIRNSSGPIVVRGLKFNMARRAPRGQPGAIWVDPDCPTPDDCPQEAIGIIHSNNVLVDRIQVLDAPRFGISIFDSYSITIRRSLFVRSGLHGIWVAAQPASRGLHVENNQFIDIRSNGAMLSVLPPDATDPLGENTVTGNVFDHNHNAAVYHVCGPTGHDPCAGGQLDIERHSARFLIADNDFRHGVMDEDPSLARDFRVTGIEIAPLEVQDIVIRHNYFHDLSSGAITSDSPIAARALRVLDNAFGRLGTGVAEINHAELVAENRGNHSDSTGDQWRRPAGSLSWTPCRPDDGQKCAAVIRWESDIRDMSLRLILNGSHLFAKSAPARGERVFELPRSQPTRLDLYAGGTLLDTIEIP